MASRPLDVPPGRPAARSPVRPNVALRWMNSVAPASDVSKTAPSPVKRWPPPSKVAAPPHATAITPSTPTPETAKKKLVSTGFQSARAVFEAKNAAAVAATPPPALTRRRLTFPSPPAPAVVKQNSASSDLSSSSCSTVESENDRKLEELCEEVKRVSTVRPSEVKKIEKESVVASAATAVTAPTYPAPSSPIPMKQAPQPQSPVLMGTTTVPAKQELSNSTKFDPFRLLFPVEVVPKLPDEVACLYDSAAIEMQKSIKKVVRKLLKKNKARQEEFRANSRLFGTDIMDSHTYLDTLIKDFGAIRALQLVPSLLSVQPDALKSNALLLTAKNYLLRNEDALERELRTLQNTSAKESTKTDIVSTDDRVSTQLAEADTLQNRSPIIEMPVKHVPTTPSTPAAVPDQVTPLVNAAQSSAQISVTGCAHTTIVKNTTPEFPVSASEVVASPGVMLAQKEPAPPKPAEGVVLSNGVLQPAEPMPEPQEAALTGSPPPVINVAVSASSPTSTTLLTVPKINADPVVKKRTEFSTPSDSEEEFRPESLFGESIKPQQIKPKEAVAATSPVSSTHSFDEAESLFGERLSFSSHTSTGRRKTVTWGETRTVVVPVERVSTVKMKPAPLIFGPATAAAFDSDSDESDFSD